MRSYKTTRIRKTILSAFVLMALIAFSSTSAFASTASNTTISNTATVNYEDTSGAAQPTVSSTAVVTVNLAAATPTLHTTPDIQTTDPGTDAVYNYTITSNANGPDTYVLNVDSITETTPGISGSTATINGFTATSIDLGASTVATTINIAANTDTDIVVPSDGTGGSSVNGIEGGDTVVIGTQLFSVISVTDNASGTSIIEVTGVTGFNASAGDLIKERGTFDLTVTPGAVNNTVVDPIITVVISAEDTAGTATAATDQTVTTVTVPILTVTKEVSTDGGENFALSANAFPETTLTYRITVTNAGTSDADAVVITDPTPQFTIYAAGTAKSDTTTGRTYAAAATTLTDVDTDGDGYDYTAGESTYLVGEVTAGNSVVLYFQVDIN